MVRALLPAGSGSPHHWREYQYRQQEKCPGDFKPDFAADGAKGLEEAAEPPRNSTCCLPCNARLARNASIAGRVYRSARLLWCGRALRVFARHGFASHAASNPQSHAQNSPDGFRSHFDMMVSAGHSETIVASNRGCQLPDSRLRIKV